MLSSQYPATEISHVQLGKDGCPAVRGILPASALPRHARRGEPCHVGLMQGWTESEIAASQPIHTGRKEGGPDDAEKILPLAAWCCALSDANLKRQAKPSLASVAGETSDNHFRYNVISCFTRQELRT